MPHARAGDSEHVEEHASGARVRSNGPPERATGATALLAKRAPDVAAVQRLQALVGNERTVQRLAASDVVVQRGKFSEHAAERGKERGISNTRAREIIRTGTKYYDPLHDNYVYRSDTGECVCVAQDGTVLTKYVRETLSPRWEKA